MSTCIWENNKEKNENENKKMKETRWKPIEKTHRKQKGKQNW